MAEHEHILEGDRAADWISPAERDIPPEEVRQYVLAASKRLMDIELQPSTSTAVRVIEVTEDNWRLAAKCRDTDPDFFFPISMEEEDVNKAFCVGCPAVKFCLNYALMHNDQKGVWGGTSEKDRKSIRRQRRAS